eukprot:COSAG06_NODE_8221_length_2233_cov_1.289597_2_plen_64_part_00
MSLTERGKLFIKHLLFRLLSGQISSQTLYLALQSVSSFRLRRQIAFGIRKLNKKAHTTVISSG